METSASISQKENLGFLDSLGDKLSLIEICLLPQQYGNDEKKIYIYNDNDNDKFINRAKYYL